MMALHAPGASPYSVVPSGLERGAPGCRWDPYHRACVRPETREEGLARYEVIAVAIATAAERDAPTWAPTMARLLTTIAAHEGSFRRDIHTGIGAPGIAVGDCAWGHRGAIAGSCRSWCLVQVNRAPHQRTPEGWLRHELGPASTPLAMFLAYGGLRFAAPDSPAGKRIAARVATYHRLSVPRTKE